MAQFNPTVITNRGQSLLAKVEAGQTALNFTKVKTSNTQYPAGTDLAGLATMTNQKQESLVSGVSFVSPASVLISSTFTNAELGEGYYVWAIGLFATDPQLGEILFSITTASTADYMPANNGVSVSSILCELVITTGNASNVNLNIDPAAVASMADIENVRGEVEEVNFSLETHEITNVNTEDGAHGIRYFDDKLWYWDGLSWAETSGGGGGIPPNNVSDLSIIIGNGQLTIKWSDPEDSNVGGVPVTWKGTKLIRKLGSYPTSITDGVLVIDNQDRNEFKEIGFIDTPLTNNQTYYYQLFPYSETNAINIDPENRISGEPQPYKTYGVRIDTTNSNPLTSVTYTDDAVGMNGGSSIWDTLPIFKNIKPCMLKNGVVQYYLNPNDFTKRADGTAAGITSGNDGDVMIEIPKTGYSIVTSGNYLDVKITDDPSKAGFVYNAHTRVTAGDRNKLYIGAYLGSNVSSKLRSLSGKAPYAGGTTPARTIGTCRTLAQANGTGYDQVSFYPLTLLQCLYMVKYKNLDSQNALGRGYVDGNSAAINTGGTDAKGMYFGETTGKQQMKFAGIEDFWGNLRWWIDGLFSDANRNIKTAFKDFNDTGANYADQGQGATANISGYMGKCQGTNTRGFITKEASGSATTYFCDGALLYASCLPTFGGYWTNADSAGAFSLYVYYSASTSNVYLGARLMFL